MLYQLFVQFLAVIAVVLFLISFHAKSRRKILLLQLIGLGIWATHFLLLSAWTGASLIIVNGLFTIVLFFKHHHKALRSIFVLYAAIVAFFIFMVFSWTSIYSIFPFLAVSCVTIAKWQDTPHLIRVLSFPASMLWIVYDYFAGAWGSIIAEVLVLISIALSVMLNRK